MIKLKQCPFCLGKAHLFLRSNYNGPDFGFDIQCMNEDCYLCDGADWYFDTESEAVDKWNKRGRNQTQKEDA